MSSNVTQRAARNEDRVVAAAVVAAQAGDIEALRPIYERYADAVYRYVRTIVRDDYEAEDITQHVFAKLIVAIGKYEQRGSPFAAWLMRLAHNVAVDHLRSCRATPAGDMIVKEARAEDVPGGCAQDLRDALASLPDDQREVVILRHVVGLSPCEIAACLGRTESSIHGLHHRGRRALQTELVRLDLEPAMRCRAQA